MEPYSIIIQLHPIVSQLEETVQYLTDAKTIPPLIPLENTISKLLVAYIKDRCANSLNVKMKIPQQDNFGELLTGYIRGYRFFDKVLNDREFNGYLSNLLGVYYLDVLFKTVIAFDGIYPHAAKSQLSGISEKDKTLIVDILRDTWIYSDTDDRSDLEDIWYCVVCDSVGFRLFDNQLLGMITSDAYSSWNVIEEKDIVILQYIGDYRILDWHRMTGIPL